MRREPIFDELLDAANPHAPGGTEARQKSVEVEKLGRLPADADDVSVRTEGPLLGSLSEPVPAPGSSRDSA